MSAALRALACPRCGGGFECGADAGHCDCFELRLSDALQAGLAQAYPGRCLCLRCLRELAAAERDAGAVGAQDLAPRPATR